MLKKIFAITLLSLSSVAAEPEKRSIDSSYKYDEKADSVEYFEYYEIGGKKIKHGIYLKISNARSKKVGPVSIQKDVYSDGEIVSTSTKGIIDFEDRKDETKGDSGKK